MRRTRRRKLFADSSLSQVWLASSFLHFSSPSSFSALSFSFHYFDRVSAHSRGPASLARSLLRTPCFSPSKVLSSFFFSY